MEAQFEQIRDAQKASWNKFAQGWEKWDSMTMEFIRPTGNKIISLIRQRKNRQNAVSKILKPRWLMLQKSHLMITLLML